MRWPVIEDAIVELLRRHPGGMTVLMIEAELEMERGDRRIKKSIAKLRSDGVIIRKYTTSEHWPVWVLMRGNPFQTRFIPFFRISVKYRPRVGYITITEG